MDTSAEEKEPGFMNAVDQFPFMLHVLAVFVITWFLPFSSNGLFYFCLLIAYLFEVERRGREKERRRITSEERRRINTKRTFDEGETSRWLNEGIKSMWPVCMQKFASKHFFGHMVPWFLNVYKPSGVNEVKIDSLHLGNTPPVFNFIRALERPPDGDHVVYEATMDFNSDDEMNAKMSVQTIRRLGGFWTTFQISRLHVEGTVRISVKFLKGWPVVGRVRLCFTSKPLVSMSYRLDKNGIDVSLIPVFANIVEKMVDNAMEHTIIEPNLLVVDIEKLVSTMFSNSRTQQGVSRFFKVENKSTLVVEILEATNLKAVDSNGLSDPFVDITFGQVQKKTKVKKKTLNAKWENEQHEFPIKNWDMPNLLTLRVRDWDRITIGSSRELGICVVPVNDHRNGERHEFNIPLEKVSKGYLRFAITVKYTHPPQMVEELRTSDSGREAVTQEMRTSSSAVDYASPVDRATPEMTRSKSETNLERLRTPPKFEVNRHSRHSSTRELESLHEQTPIGENSDIIDMPYGPPGAFTIFHPGLQGPLFFPLPKKENDLPIPKSSELDKSGEIKQFRLNRYFQRRRRKNGAGTSQETVQVDTMSEQSGISEGSVDISAELKDFNLKYHGPVRMTLDCPELRTEIAPAESPLMEIAPINVSGQLEPNISKKSPTTPASNTFFGSAHDTGPGEVDTRGPPFYWWRRVENVNPKLGEAPTGERVEVLSSSHPPPSRSPPKRQEARKPTFSLPTTWYKKMTLLAKQAKKRKKRHDKSEVIYSSELQYPTGDVYPDGDRQVPFYHEESDQSIPSGPQIFTFESPLNKKCINNAGTPGYAPGDFSEERKIINSRSSSASGSQSDRHWASKVKKLIPDKWARTSQSFRHDTLDLKRLQTPVRDSSLTTIPEKSAHQRHGKLRP